jgi:hypothetical protein
MARACEKILVCYTVFLGRRYVYKVTSSGVHLAKQDHLHERKMLELLREKLDLQEYLNRISKT